MSRPDYYLKNVNKLVPTMESFEFFKALIKSCKWNLSLRSNLRMVLGSGVEGDEIASAPSELRFARNDRGRSVKRGYAKLSFCIILGRHNLPST